MVAVLAPSMMAPGRGRRHTTGPSPFRKTQRADFKNLAMCNPSQKSPKNSLIMPPIQRGQFLILIYYISKSLIFRILFQLKIKYSGAVTHVMNLDNSGTHLPASPRSATIFRPLKGRADIDTNAFKRHSFDRACKIPFDPRPLSLA
jgi:hypothetical protein